MFAVGCLREVVTDGTIEANGVSGHCLGRPSGIFPENRRFLLGWGRKMLDGILPGSRVFLPLKGIIVPSIS